MFSAVHIVVYIVCRVMPYGYRVKVLIVYNERRVGVSYVFSVHTLLHVV